MIEDNGGGNQIFPLVTKLHERTDEQIACKSYFNSLVPGVY